MRNDGSVSVNGRCHTANAQRRAAVSRPLSQRPSCHLAVVPLTLDSRAAVTSHESYKTNLLKISFSRHSSRSFSCTHTGTPLLSLFFAGFSTSFSCSAPKHCPRILYFSTSPLSLSGELPSLSFAGRESVTCQCGHSVQALPFPARRAGRLREATLFSKTERRKGTHRLAGPFLLAVLGYGDTTRG